MAAQADRRLDSQGQVVGMLEAIAKDGDYECFIISANVIWEALQLTGPEHPSGICHWGDQRPRPGPQTAL